MDRFHYSQSPLDINRMHYNETPEEAFVRKHSGRFDPALFEILRLRSIGCMKKEIRSRMKKYVPPSNKYTQLTWTAYHQQQ